MTCCGCHSPGTSRGRNQNPPVMLTQEFLLRVIFSVFLNVKPLSPKGPLSWRRGFLERLQKDVS